MLSQRPMLYANARLTTRTQQELVQEYVTRFSSWKRVKHVATGRTFTQLREAMSGAARGRAQACMCAEAMAQRRKVLLHWCTKR